MSADLPPVVLDDVVAWLRANRLGLTALQLYEELSHCCASDGSGAEAKQRRGLLTVAEASLPPACSTSSLAASPPAVASDAEEELEASIIQAVTYYRRSHSARDLQTLLHKHNLPQPGDTYFPEPQPPPTAATSAMEEMRASVREMTRRWQTAEQQHKALLGLLAHALPTLVNSIEPMRRDALLPLLKAVAVAGGTVGARDSARHQILTLFRRPTAAQRGEIARTWLQLSQGASSQRTLQQEVIPQLYSLVNDTKWERRVLALDCTAALAPLLRMQPVVRHQLAQGILQPLSEDASAFVRKEVPVCLSTLWSAAFEAAETAPELDDTANPRAGGGENATDVGPLGTPDQLKYAMELSIQLSIDPLSNTVRHAAQTQLREVMFPLCLQKHRLLSACVPLLLSFLADELRPLCANDSNTSATATLATATGVDGGLPRPVTVRAETSLHLRNSLALLKLVRDALRCVQVEVVNVREHAPADVAERVQQKVRQVFLEDTLPTTYSLLPLCVSDAAPGVARHSASAAVLLSEPLSPPSPHTRGSLLASLALVVASVAPVLDGPWWQGVQHFLCASIHLDAERATADSEHVEESQTHRRCRLLFFYAFLIRVCGEGASTGAVAPPGQQARTPAVSGGGSVSREAIALILRTFPGTSARLANESLDICARCLAVLVPAALDDPHVPAGITALLWTCARASSAPVRSQAVTLISRTCRHLRSDEVKVSLICPPLLVLVRDDVYVVQEAAVRCLFRVGAFLSGTAAQEKALQPVMDAVAAAGCTSDLTTSFLQYVEELVKEMPAEPRENQLYLFLCVLMDQLADQQLRRVKQRKRSGSSTPAGSTPGASTDDLQEQERWEATMLALQSLLTNILHCAVVSPHLVAKFLLSGIKHLGGDSVQRVCSSTLRSRWTRLEKTYDLFMENSRSPGAVAAQNATNLLNRVRDELKKHF